MGNDLATPGDLAGFPGAPFTDFEVDAAVAKMRSDLGWHVAPVRESTVELDVVECEPTLRLPTRLLLSVEEVRDADTAIVTDPTCYRVSKSLGRIRRKSGFWPAGYGRVEVDFTHGYEECPPELYEVLAEYARNARRDANVQSVRVDDGSLSYFSGSGSAPVLSSVLSRYAVPEWSGMA